MNLEYGSEEYLCKLKYRSWFHLEWLNEDTDLK